MPAMNDKPIILAGLVIALVVLTEGRCVEDAGYMKAHHMELLDRWRDEVVRGGDRTPVMIDGKPYPKSLTRGCLACHASRQDFCARCHQYANVEPTCWHCHVDAIEK